MRMTDRLPAVALGLAACVVAASPCLAIKPPAERFYFLGVEALQDGHPSQALSLLEEVATAPEVDLETGKYKHIEYRKELIQLLINEGVAGVDPSFNIAKFGEALRARAHVRIAEVHMGEQRYEDAGRELERAKLRDALYPMAYCRSAQALLATGDLPNAIKDAKQAFLYSPTYGEYRRTYATAVAKDATQLYEKGQTGKARLAYEFAFQIDPLNPETMSDYGWLLYTGREQPYSVDEPGARALRLYTKHNGIYFLEQATRLAPNEPRYMVRMGQVYEREAQWQRALEWYQKAMRLAEDSVDARLGAARCFNAIGAHESAVSVLREALKSAGGERSVEVECELAAARRGDGAMGGAVAAARSALASDPNSARAQYELGLALRAQGATKPALEAFKRADVLDPKGHVGLQARVHMMQLRSIERVGAH